MNRSRPYYLIIGLGASGLSMARFLVSRGETVVATDIDPKSAHAADELGSLDIETQIGFHDADTFNRAFAIIPSPGVPLSNPYIQNAVKAGVPITGELDIFSRFNTLPVIAITGTNGKTTTTTLAGDILKAAGMSPFVGGNIGTPLVEQLLLPGENDIIVAEVSSFQLDISKDFRPDVGVLLNISEDHLDRYDGFSAYEASKWGLFKNQSEKDTAVINQSIDGFEKMAPALKSRLLTFSSAETAQKNSPDAPNARITSKEIRILVDAHTLDLGPEFLESFRGLHNKENLAAATLACLSAGATEKAVVNALKNFRHLPHRMAHVADINGVSFFNDSKATNTDAVIRALECFETPVILILGGREKGTDFSQLADAAKTRVKTIVALGESKEKISQILHPVCPVEQAETMEDAVKTAFKTAKKGDVVLLSPACASFDQYQNYAARGNDFADHVERLKGNG